jgi:cell pole-organizing protein PopZ
MNLRTVVILCLFTAIPATGFAQNQSAPPPAPTLAEVQKLVQTISADKAKLQIYCQLAKLNDQIAAAEEKHDAKTVQALSEQGDALEQKLGPDYAKVMDGLGPMDPESPLFKQITAPFDTLDNQCK